jgi:hypothetical protein
MYEQDEEDYDFEYEDDEGGELGSGADGDAMDLIDVENRYYNAKSIYMTSSTLFNPMTSL